MGRYPLSILIGCYVQPAHPLHSPKSAVDSPDPIQWIFPGSDLFFWPIGAGRLAKCDNLARRLSKENIYNYLYFQYFLYLLLVGTTSAQTR